MRPSRPSNKEARLAAAHEAKKELARRIFKEFVKQAWHVIEPTQKFVSGWHIDAICEHLEAVSCGLIKQLLINVPPGTMKSLLVCVFWPAWEWISNPGKRFMFSSYADVLSLRDSVRTRDILLSKWYQDRWPLQLKDDQNAKGRFDNEKGGWRIIGSVGGKGIGEHPDYNVGDDPHNVLQAESEADRQTVTHWVEGVFCVRGEVRDAARVMVMQRLHASDASGVLLEKGGWEHICLPMEYEATEKKLVNGVDTIVKKEKKPTCLGFVDPRTEDGELLWPSVYTPTKVANLKVNMGIYGVAGQLQQHPSPRGGGTFERGWFEILPALPVIMRFVRYWDKAGTKGGGGAQTSGVLMGKYEDSGAAIQAMREKFIIIDVLSGRWAAAEREAVIKQTAQSDQARYGHVEIWTEQEPGSGGKESAEGTIGNLVGFSVYLDRVTGSKEVRATPLATQASVGKVKLLAGKWNGAFLDELEVFPMGKLKDMVDAASGSFNKLVTSSGAAQSSPTHDVNRLTGARRGESMW